MGENSQLTPVLFIEFTTSMLHRLKKIEFCTMIFMVHSPLKIMLDPNDIQSAVNLLISQTQFTSLDWKWMVDY